MSETFNIDSIEIANTEKRYTVEVPFKIQRDGREVEIKYVLEYRPLTNPMLTMPIGEALAAAVTEMHIEDSEGKRFEVADKNGKVAEPSVEFFDSRPIPFVRKLIDGVRDDFFPTT